MLCAVALVLLLDASGSIRPDEWSLQVQGTAEAFEDPRVVRAIERHNGIAVKAIAFTEVGKTLTPWMVVRDAADGRAFASALRNSPRPRPGGTSIARALDAAGSAFNEAPCVADEHIVDLSTDGEADAQDTRVVRDRLIAEGVKVNAIGVSGSYHSGEQAAAWLRENAVTPGGFAVAASWADYARIVLRKITLEVSGR